MERKIRKHRISKINLQVKSIPPKISKKEKLTIKEKELILSPYDKIVWVYKRNKFSIIEITTVSYVANILDKDYTIIYYDNSHGGMHSHLRVSIQDQSDAPISLRVRKRGDQGKLMHWAIKDIMINWYYYRKKFYIRSGLKPDF